MALVLANRVQETTTTTGTGTVTLAGAVAGFQSFAVIGDANTTYYTITSGNDWEVGIGTYTSSGTTLARTTVLSSSAGGTTKINLAGTSTVFVTYPSEDAILDGYGLLPVANGGTGVTASTGTVAVVLSNSPTLVTPILGAASATSITNALGAVGTPSYTFTGDTNTGIYSPAADTIAFVEGGVEAMRIDASGNVGIGATTPGGKTEIVSSGSQTSLLLRNSSSDAATHTEILLAPFTGTTAASASIRNIFSQNDNSILTFATTDSSASPTERMRIDGSGNVGIGTTSLSALGLKVSKGSGVAAGVAFSNAANNWQIETGTTTNFLAITDNQFAERIRIDATGNVGIGTASPSYKLSVSGTAEITAAKEGVFAITDGATVNLDPNNGSIQTWTLGANRTPDQANWAAGQSITLMIDDGSAYTITWSTLNPVWETNGGTAPTLATSGYTVIVLWKVGTTIYGARVGDA